MKPTSEKRQLGEYRLRELHAENTLCWTWLAEQVSVSRLVLVDELRADEAAQSDRFLANCRAKASVDHPLIGSVYEAVAEPGLCFYAHELLTGTTLAQRKRSGTHLSPAHLALLLRRVSDANLKHESLNRATAPLHLESIHLDENGVVRLKNLAIAGHRTPTQSTRDIRHLGAALTPLVAPDQPATNRLLTVLGWMRGEEIEAPLTWAQIRGYCLQIEQQLLAATPTPALTTKRSLAPKKRPYTWLALSTGLALAIILTTAILIRSASKPKPLTPVSITIPTGDYPTLDGSLTSLPTFRISAAEISIAQYAAFLAAAPPPQPVKNQPAHKTSYQPADWPAQLAAATTSGKWNGYHLTLDSPVTNVDYWDATAYAQWKNARLPSHAEWYAALSSQTRNLNPGSVSEWTGLTEPTPANPLGPLHWVIADDSPTTSPRQGIRTREWVPAPSLRRPNLGFRIVLEN